jgi:alpha-tubulin suppressor-like RCC1 family protein
MRGDKMSWPSFVMVSAGAKHTLAVSKDLKLWFCGDREAIGECTTHDLQPHQPELMQLISSSKRVSSENFMFVSACHKKNFAIN